MSRSFSSKISPIGEIPSAGSAFRGSLAVSFFRDALTVRAKSDLSRSDSAADIATPPMRPPSLRLFSFLRPLVATMAISIVFRVSAAEPRDPAKLATEFCVGCHGVNLAGAVAPSLIDDNWKYGSDDASILRAILDGFPQVKMPGFGPVPSEAPQRGLIRDIPPFNRQ